MSDYDKGGLLAELQAITEHLKYAESLDVYDLLHNYAITIRRELNEAIHAIKTWMPEELENVEQEVN